MTGNIFRPYEGDTRKAAIKLPAFSRTRADMIFRRGDIIDIFAFPEKRPVSAVWRLCRNMVNKEFMAGEAKISYDQTVSAEIQSDKLLPGFYDLHFSVKFAQNDISECKTTFGYRIEDMQISASFPQDFNMFWMKKLNALSNIQLNMTEEFIGEFSRDEIERYNIENASLPEDYAPEKTKHERVKLWKLKFDSLEGRRMSAWFAVPAADGPFPGLLLLPGAGCAKLPAPLDQARRGYASLMLHVHGMDIDQEEYEAPTDYLKYQEEKGVDGQYYCNVYLSCVQALKCLASRAEVDAARLAVAGASQGGLLSIVVAALCPEVKATVAPICYYSYWPYRDLVEDLNEKGISGMELEKPPFDMNDVRQKCFSYYDAINFARKVNVPTLSMACLCDEPSPPTTVYAMFRNLKCRDKELKWSPCANHDMSFQFERDAWGWLEKKLNIS